MYLNISIQVTAPNNTPGSEVSTVQLPESMIWSQTLPQFPSAEMSRSYATPGSLMMNSPASVTTHVWPTSHTVTCSDTVRVTWTNTSSHDLDRSVSLIISANESLADVGSVSTVTSAGVTSVDTPASDTVSTDTRQLTANCRQTEGCNSCLFCHCNVR